MTSIVEPSSKEPKQILCSNPGCRKRLKFVKAEVVYAQAFGDYVVCSSCGEKTGVGDYGCLMPMDS